MGLLLINKNKFMKNLLLLLLVFIVSPVIAQIGELIYDENGYIVDTENYSATTIQLDISLKDSTLEWVCKNIYQGSEYILRCYIISYKTFIDPIDSLTYHSFIVVRDSDCFKAEFILQLDNNSYTLIPEFTYKTNEHHYVTGGAGLRLNIY